MSCPEEGKYEDFTDGKVFMERGSPAELLS